MNTYESKTLKRMRLTISEIERVEREMEEERRRAEIEEMRQAAERIRREEENYG